VKTTNMWPRNAWALRHLNWTLILYTNLCSVPIVGLVLLVEYQDNVVLLTSLVAATLLYIACCAYLYVWNLRRKGQSLWNMFLLLIPYIGGWIFLFLDNKLKIAQDAHEILVQDNVSEKYFKEGGN
jgi:hypothetical protein